MNRSTQATTNHESRPAEGWLKTARQSAGLSLQTVANRLNVSPQAVHQFEKSEMAGTLSLRQLEKVAGAIGFQMTYALVSLVGAKGQIDGELGSKPFRNRLKVIPPRAAAVPQPPVSLDRFSITSD